MSDKATRARRREQQRREVEASQQTLRQSIAETKKLVADSDQMLKRHHRECEDDDTKP